MKKLLSLLVIVCMTVFCLSCHKDDNNKNNGNDNNSSPGTEDPSGGGNVGLVEGVYQPAKKISRVIINSQTNVTTSSGTQVYNWEDNNLKSISENNTIVTNVNGNHVENSESTFTYTYSDNRLVRIDILYAGYNSYIADYNGYIECQYDGNKISIANAFLNGKLSATYTYTYTNNYITKIEELILSDKHGVVEKDLYRIQGVPGMDLTKILRDASPKHYPKAGSKNTFILTWNNGNVTRVEATNDEDPNMWCTVEAEYDTYNNPHYGFFWAVIAEAGVVGSSTGGSINGLGGSFCNYSKNNLKRVTITYPLYVMVGQFAYTYEGTYPKTYTSTITTSTSGVVTEGHGVGEYEYIN